MRGPGRLRLQANRCLPSSWQVHSPGRHVRCGVQSRVRTKARLRGERALHRRGRWQMRGRVGCGLCQLEPLQERRKVLCKGRSMRGSLRRRLPSRAALSGERKVRGGGPRAMHRGFGFGLPAVADMRPARALLREVGQVRCHGRGLQAVSRLQTESDVHGGQWRLPHRGRRGLRRLRSLSTQGIVYGAGRSVHGSLR